MCFSIISFACLTGSPLAGVLIEKDNGGFLYAQAFGGSACAGGAFFLIAAQLAKRSLPKCIGLKHEADSESTLV